MDVHNYLGKGLLEVVYKDALEYEFENAGIQFEREKEYFVNYKNIILPHRFYADFMVYDKIILEVKAAPGIENEFYCTDDQLPMHFKKQTCFNGKFRWIKTNL